MGILELFLIQGVGLSSMHPANHLSTDIQVQVSYESIATSFTYQYRVTNNATSEQSAESFEVVVDDSRMNRGGTLRDLDGPRTGSWSKGWVVLNQPLGRTVTGWSAGKYDPTDLQKTPTGLLLPGETAEGFRYTSKGLPTVQAFYVQGYVRPLNETELMEAATQLTGKHYGNSGEVPDEIVNQLIPPPHLDSFSGTTIGAQVLSAQDSRPAPLAARLIRLKDQAAGLGWIKDPGTVTSLNQKLRSVQTALRRGRTKAAKGALNAFLNEIEAQRGVHLDDNAYYLLKANAEYLISRL